MQQKISTVVGTLILIIMVLTAGAFLFKVDKFDMQNLYQPINNLVRHKNKACTMEAKLCPDGTYISRTGPDCEFTPCPDNTMKDKIIVSSPKFNQEIASPVSVSGQARGDWFFEGTFPVEVYDSNGKLLGLGPATFMPKNASDTWMTDNFVDFKGKIKFSEPATTSGYVLFKKDNPSGNPAMDESLRLDVKFGLGSADSWKNYENGQYGFTLTFPESWKGFVATHRLLDWGSDGTSDSIDFGFPEQKDGLFNISFHTKKQYDSISSSGAPFGQKLGESNGYVFVWDQAQYATNADMQKRMSEIAAIIKTFKLVK
jgi:hypothetical protein